MKMVTQEQQVIEVLRRAGGYATLRRLNELVDFSTWATKTPEARKMAKVPHYYNYELMKAINGDKQMTDVWRLPAIAPWEKTCGKHPTQKPLSLMSRIILASTEPGAWIAILFGRRIVSIKR